VESAIVSLVNHPQCCVTDISTGEFAFLGKARQSESSSISVAPHLISDLACTPSAELTDSMEKCVIRIGIFVFPARFIAILTDHRLCHSLVSVR
jgi:hypothetical protein